MTGLSPLKKRDLPNPPPLRKLIGPSFILLGLGLGSGELILWPYLSANYGMGIIWAAVLGITFQFFLNMEIERYTIITGESIFVGMARKYGKLSPFWFILSTLVPWIWPGIIAASAVVFAAGLGIEYSGKLSIALLLLIGLILSLGKVVYKTQEKVQKMIIMVSVPFILFITLFLSKPADFKDLAFGLVGKGDGFWFLPEQIPLAIFLGAFAYAGAGGNLNLAQSLYAKEKGYGMGKYSGRITSIFKGVKEKVSLEGVTFECNEKNLNLFKIWWKRLNIEHGIVFWLTGAVTMILLSLLSYISVFNNPGVETSINFLIVQANVISSFTFSFLGTFFLLLAGLTLFGTQFSVFGSTARIMSENLIIMSPEKFKIEKLSRFFYFFLWLQIACGIIVLSLGFTEPLGLVVTGALLNAFSMFVYTGLVYLLNVKSLEKPLRPSLLRRGVLIFAFFFYGILSVFTIYHILF